MRRANLFGMTLLLGVAACSSSQGSQGATTDGGTQEGGGGSGGAGGGTVNAGEAAKACTDVVAAQCGILAQCLPEFLQYLYGDVDTCKTRESINCAATFSLAGTSRSPDKTEGCAQAVTGLTCDQYLTGTPPDACKTMPGTLANGAACSATSQGAQCASGHCNIQASICGACSDGPATGAQCIDSSDCADTDVCVGATDTALGQCAIAVGPGAACDAAHGCEPGYYCSGGVCAANKAVGAACTTQDECNGVREQICDIGGSNTCVAIQFAAAGQPCGLVNNVYVGCAALGACVVATATATQGTCQAAPKDGAACGTGAQAVSCLPPAVCDNGVCKISDPLACK